MFTSSPEKMLWSNRARVVLPLDEGPEMPIMSVLSVWSSVACGSASGILFCSFQLFSFLVLGCFIGLLSKRTGMAIINTLQCNM